MTKKDFELIVDAINEGIIDTVNDPLIVRDLADTSDSLQKSYSKQRVGLILRTKLGESFAKRLKYTADGFDPARFKMKVRDAGRA